MRAFASRALPALLALWALGAPAAASPRRLDQDFEFDDAPVPPARPSRPVALGPSPGASAPSAWRRREPRARLAARLVHTADRAVAISSDEPEPPVLQAAPGPPRRARRYVFDPDNALCRALVCPRREVCLLRDARTALCVRSGDARARGAAELPRARDDELYEARAEPAEPAEPERCVGCAGAARGAFLCGSDNRTYSSLCRLDLHNCVRRAARPVRLACRGFCPCRAAAAPPEDRRRRRLEAHNEADAERPHSRRQAAGAAGCALDKMADRLLDWFAVLMDDAAAQAPPPDGFPRDCKPEVRWMFAHLDRGRDGLLSPADLFALRHDERERCLRPFLRTCGAARGVSRAAWCGCLRRAARPCAALARAHAAPPPGAYVPACDARGWYRARQCHAALGVCWCVDAHGAERPGSRTKGAPQCPEENETDNSVSDESERAGDTARAPADDEDLGSGDGDDDDDDDVDNELRF